MRQLQLYSSMKSDYLSLFVSLLLPPCAHACGAKETEGERRRERGEEGDSFDAEALRARFKTNGRVILTRAAYTIASARPSYVDRSTRTDQPRLRFPP